MNLVRRLPILFLWTIVLLTGVEAVCAQEAILQPAAIPSAGVTNAVDEKGISPSASSSTKLFINKWSSVKFDHGISPAFVWTWVLIIAIAISGILFLFLLWNKSLKNQVKNRTVELNTANQILKFEIIERKQTEDALLESEEKFRTLVTNTEEIVYMVAKDGTFLLSEGKGLSQLGVKPGEVVGKSVFELYKDYPDMLEEMRRAFNGESVSSEVNIDGHYFRSWFTPHQNHAGEIIGLLGLSVNITGQKQAEEKLQQYQQRLKSLAVQLTLAEEQERRRISEDLHDYIGQSLALSRMQLAAARKGLPQSDKRDAQFDDISQSLLKAIQDTRHLIFELSSPSLNELGLAAAISEWMDENVVNKHGIEAELFDHAQDFPLEIELRTLLFRNVRELLSNAIKHAGAKTISVWLESRAENLEITIQDDGVGFDYGNCRRSSDDCGGFGLFSVRERMSDLGGKLTISSHPGAGCKAVLDLPLHKAERGNSSMSDIDL